MSAPALVGRSAELDRLVDAVTDPPAIAFIEGEAGIGKSRLVRECLGSPDVADRTVLVAACPPLTESFPLGPVVDGVRRLRPQIRDVDLSPLGGALRPLFPEWADLLPPALEPLEDPAETRHRLFGALSELVEALDVDLLLVEDGHWADSATLEWLLTLTTASDRPLSMVVTYRPTDLPEGSLLRRLTSRATPGVTRTRVELKALDVDDTRRLVGSMLSTDDVSDNFAAFLHEHTDGVPLALEETIRLLRDRHDIIRQHGSWTRKVLHELEVPPTLRDSVLERIDRLAPETRVVLQAAAVLAEPAGQALLTGVTGLEDQAVRQGVAAALAAGLLSELGSGQLVFRHVLDAQAVLEALPASELRLLHRAAAENLQQVEPTPVVRLARHVRAAGDDAMWCRYGEAAADLAWESGDDEAAVTTLLDLLTAVAHPTDRKVRLARKLGEYAFFGAVGLGDLSSQVVAVLRDAAADDGLPRADRGEIRLQLGRMLWLAGDLDAAFAEHEQAIPDLDHRPDLAVWAMVNLAKPVVADRSVEWHLGWLDRASEIASTIDSPLERQTFAISRAGALLSLGDDHGWQSIDEPTVSASTQRERRLVAADWLRLADVTLVWGRYADNRRWLNDALDHIRATDYQRLANAAALVGARLDWYTGAWPELGKTAAALVDDEDTDPLDRLGAPAIVGLLDLAGGHRTAAERRLRQVVDDYGRHGTVDPVIALASAGLGRLYLADDAVEAALGMTGAVVEMIARKGVWLWLTDVAPTHVTALVEAGRNSEAAALVDRFAAGIAGRRNAPAPAAALATCRAILAGARQDPAAAAALFAEAAASWAALPRPYDELLALEQQGRCLLAAEAETTGLKVLAEAQARLAELGAKWDSDRAAQLLRQHGMDVARTWRRGRHGYGEQLSPRELEVVALVAKGMSNKQVAEVLFISPRTVTRHLSTAMRKLNVSSRTAVAMAAAEAGLLSTDDAG